MASPFDSIPTLGGGGPSLGNLPRLGGSPAAAPAPTADESIAASGAALDALQSAFAARARDEGQRFRDATDSEYWVAVCFQSRAQKEEFLRRLKLDELGDKYLDGVRVAQRLGVPLETEAPKWRASKPSPRLRGLTKP